MSSYNIYTLDYKILLICLVLNCFVSIKQRLRSWLGVSPISGKGFNDDEREQSANIRALKREQQRLREQLELEKQKFELEKLQLEIAQQRAELYEDDDEETDNNEMSMLMPLIMGLLNKNAPVAQEPQGIPASQVAKTQYTDEEIRDIITKLPRKYIKIARSMPEGTVRKLIVSHMPSVSDDTIERALIILKET